MTDKPTKKMPYRDALAAFQKALPSLTVDDVADALVETYTWEQVIDLQDLLFAWRQGQLEIQLKEAQAREALEPRPDGGAA